MIMPPTAQLVTVTRPPQARHSAGMAIKSNHQFCRKIDSDLNMSCSKEISDWNSIYSQRCDLHTKVHENNTNAILQFPCNSDPFIYQNDRTSQVFSPVSCCKCIPQCKVSQKCCLLFLASMTV